MTDGSAVETLLSRARSGLHRLHPKRVDDQIAAGAVVVDMHLVEQRTGDGAMPDAVVVDRSVLEWRLDPSSPYRLSRAVDTEVLYLLVSNQSYSSTLAAATLQELGLHRDTDLIGGYRAWMVWQNATG